MLKKCLILILVACLCLNCSLAESAGGSITITLPEDIRAGVEAEAVIACTASAAVTVNASVIYANGTADLLLIGHRVALDNGTGTVTLLR